MPVTRVNGFTKTQRNILAILSDGFRHSPQELHKALWDEMSAVQAVRPHIFHIRQKLRPMGQDIVCEYYGRKYWYRHVRLITSGE